MIIDERKRMPTELEELVEFLHHGNTEIRQIAVENLIPYSSSQPSIFKRKELEPIKDLKLLIRDYPAIAKNVLSILVNLTAQDQEITRNLAGDDQFLEAVMLKVTHEKEPNADGFAMLLANLAKSDNLLRLLNLKRSIPKSLSSSDFAIDQLMDCFVKGAGGSYNKSANFDYLSYFFADLAKHQDCRTYFTSSQSRDNNIIPLTKLTVFTEHKSDIRRAGVAATIKNAAFEIPAHPKFLASAGTDAINVLPYILLPIMGSEDYSIEDTDGMLEDLQLLPPDKEREKDKEIIKTHLDTLLLLTTTREGRDVLRSIKAYPIIRETHAHVDDDEVRECCDRLVQVLMRDEEGEGEGTQNQRTRNDDDDDEKIVDIL